MTAFSDEDLAAWAERKRVRAHLTDGRADPEKCTCAGADCLAAEAVADHFRAHEDQR
ncbi:MAG: hypothetical protein M0005_06380 [Actinomycetota bacterium]|jgi:hypothetical protein|nr:hypothetical protein [Actinomycetota bacterium]